MEGSPVKLKIAIAIPVYGNPEAMFLQSLTSMLSYFYETQLRAPDGTEIEKVVETFVVSGIIQTARHRLFAEATQWEADYILWCDADHTFPPDALNRLIVHNRDIVGCNYARRVIGTEPTSPTAAVLDRDGKDEKLCYTTPEKAEAGELEEVDHLGLGLCLMRMSILDRLQDKAEADGLKSFMPLFRFTPKPDSPQEIGEDVFFFDKCKQAGLSAWCDHALSWELGHITKRILTNAHAVRDAARWREKEGA